MPASTLSLQEGGVKSNFMPIDDPFKRSFKMHSTDDVLDKTKRKKDKDKKLNRTRTMSVFTNVSDLKNDAEIRKYRLKRRASEDDTYISSKGIRRFFIKDVDRTLAELLKNEDTDENFQITVEDNGPKVITLGTANSGGYNHINIRGTYMLSNLLQELTIAKNLGYRQLYLPESRLNENPVIRLKRTIETFFWDSLTRKIDLHTIGQIAADSKINTPEAMNPRVYVPYNCPEQYEYFIQASQMNPSVKLEVEYLPKDITPEFVQTLNNIPGLLALAMEEHVNPASGEVTLSSFPYVVPGGRFNELYGWDSYLITLGVLLSNRLDLARGMLEHFIFEIEHYGKILNANRTYYLCRSQPPFLTDMANVVFKHMGATENPTAVDLLHRAFAAAIKEYKTVWMAAPRLDEKTGLSCYHPDGVGIPPETEPEHFDTKLRPYAKKYCVTIPEFRRMYNAKEVYEPELDEYFLNDRGVRESGHDTSYRLEGVCAHLATIDLNALLYKYEVDIGTYIKEYCDDHYVDPYDKTTTSSKYWFDLADKRKETITKCMWDEEAGFFFDYNVQLEKRTSYESATTFWSLWAGLATDKQADIMVQKAIPKLEVLGGLVACTEKSRGPITLDRPYRQWDYPFGWAPHQILAWKGLSNYGYQNVAARIAYRWLYMMTKAFVDYNGIVVEKYDVTKCADPHRVDAEYGNQGANFKGFAREGFGWVNSSYLLGLEYLDVHAKKALGACIPPMPFFKSLKKSEKEKYGLS
ncbi:Cytosolic neutral trehalase [Nakaseomyces bracarensis]|uniref:Trehalase n=1 Tax=Nakaseomyces bracarensis TaxID=273131 RepID=A0ABR4NQV8_9SACH